MVKRQKWTDKEDLDLHKFVSEGDSDPKWDLIAYQMEQIGNKKNAKQCRERLVNKMDASA